LCGNDPKNISTAIFFFKKNLYNKDNACHFMKGKTSKEILPNVRAYNLNSKKTKYNIPCDEEPELYLTP
jgi:hypothetical protein